MPPGRFPFRSSTPSNPRIQNVSLGNPDPSPPPVTLEYAVVSALRRWIKDRTVLAWRNFKADRAFCGDAFNATFTQGRWSNVIALLTFTNKWTNRVASIGILAIVIGLYYRSIYPIAGFVGTVIVVLSMLVLGSLVTIRVTRKLYEKVAATSSGAQSQMAELTGTVETLKLELASTTERLQDLEKRLEPRFSIRFEPYTYPFMQYFKRREITQYRVCVKSPVAVRDAELVVNRVRLNGTQYNDVHLRPMHDRQEGGTKRVKLSPFKEAAWDVVSEHSPGGVVLNCIAALGWMVFEDGEHEFELMVTGGDSLPATKVVKMLIRDRQIVSFELNDGRLTELII